jgi:hypothetical protein
LCIFCAQRPNPDIHAPPEGLGCASVRAAW